MFLTKPQGPIAPSKPLTPVRPHARRMPVVPTTGAGLAKPEIRVRRCPQPLDGGQLSRQDLDAPALPPPAPTRGGVLKGQWVHPDPAGGGVRVLAWPHPVPMAPKRVPQVGALALPPIPAPTARRNFIVYFGGKPYTVVKRLGAGTYGAVFRVVDERGRSYADKRIATPDEDSRSRAAREIAIHRPIRHPNVVALFDNEPHALRSMHLLMEYVAGGELFARRKSFPWNHADVASSFYGIVDALTQLHRDEIMHRDIKLENILCEDRPDGLVLKLADFGLSKWLQPDQPTCSITGSLSTMAPEVLSGAGYDTKADVWSLGIVLFTVLVGRLPYDGCLPASRELAALAQFATRLKPQVLESVFKERSLSDEVRQLLLGMLAPGPRARLTMAAVQAHPFFAREGAAYRARRLQPPKLPALELYDLT